MVVDCCYDKGANCLAPMDNCISTLIYQKSQRPLGQPPIPFHGNSVPELAHPTTAERDLSARGQDLQHWTRDEMLQTAEELEDAGRLDQSMEW